MTDANSSGDSRELEDLFDSIASAAAPARSSLMQQLREIEAEVDDSDELQALFDAVVAATQPGTLASEVPLADGGENDEKGEKEGKGDEGDEGDVNEKVFRRVGQMARRLHDTLGELGYHELLDSAAAALPDTTDRLNYVATLTEQAACRVLNATDIANPLQDHIEAGAAALAARWDALYANQMSVDEFKQLAAETRSFLKEGLPQKTDATKAQLLEIMMAQDFQDLTGQVIKKTIAVAQELETQLMGVLIETMPGERRTESVMSLLNGPVVNGEGRSDVVASQQQVDELLDSLGF